MSKLKILIDNNRVKITDYTINPNESWTKTYALPTITWQIGTGTHDIIVNGASKSETVKDKHICFYYHNTSVNIKNTGSSPYRQFVFELQTAPKYSEEQFKKILSQALYSPKVGDNILFENEYCRVWDMVLPPLGGARDTHLHQHCVDYVFVPYGPSFATSVYGLKDENLGDFIFDDGYVYFSEINNGGFEADGKTLEKWPTHWPKNLSDKLEFAEALVEFK